MDIFKKRPFDYTKDLRSKIQHALKHDMDGIFVQAHFYETPYENIKNDFPIAMVKAHTVEGDILKICIKNRKHRQFRFVDYVS